MSNNIPYSKATGYVFINHEPLRSFVCQICGKPGTSTHRLAKTHPGACTEERKRRSKEKSLRKQRKAA